ncbi:MAG: synthase family protein [Flavisolibacter sp.]|nr:synthase family protein [Flavisolibacter sp.]
MKIKAQQFHHEWFLLFAPAFVVLHGFVRYPESIYWIDIVLLFLEYSFWSIAITVASGFFLSFRRASFFSLSLFMFNAVFGSLYDFVTGGNSVHFFTRYSFILPFFLLLFASLFIILKKSKRNYNKATRFMNLVFLLFIAMEVFAFSANKWMTERNLTLTTTSCFQCPRPDIYLLITDGYAGQKQLHEQFGFDNSAFEDSLRVMGFHIVDSSISNYAATFSSMATLLNMEYKEINPEGDVHVAFNSNKVTQFFKKLDYKIKNNSIFKVADQFPFQPSMYFPVGTWQITRHTFISRVKKIVSIFLYARGVDSEIQRIRKIQRDNIDMETRRDSITLQNLLTEVKTREKVPRFVYTHFLMPHPPYLFNKNGQQPDSTVLKETQYIDYLQYTNGQLLKAVTAILHKTETPPIILLLSDHGYRNDDLPAPTPLRFHNFAAIYLPQKDYRQYYKGVSNVNQFRILLNTHFKQQLPLLPDSTAN